MAEGTRLLSEYGDQTPSRVRIPPSPFAGDRAALGNAMRALFVGDVVGPRAVDWLAQRLPALRARARASADSRGRRELRAGRRKHDARGRGAAAVRGRRRGHGRQPCLRRGRGRCGARPRARAASAQRGRRGARTGRAHDTGRRGGGSRRRARRSRRAGRRPADRPHDARALPRVGGAAGRADDDHRDPCALGDGQAVAGIRRWTAGSRPCSGPTRMSRRSSSRSLRAARRSSPRLA